MYIDQIKESLASFAINRRYMDIRDERCTISDLKTARLGRNINALKVVVMKVEGERGELKCMLKMMTSKNTVLLRRRDNISRERECNSTNIVGLIFHLEEAETICSCLMDKAKASRFKIRAKGEAEAEFRRALKAGTERRGVIESEVRIVEDMAAEAL